MHYGHTSPSHLVNHHFTPDSFHIIQRVSNHLEHLMLICKHLPELDNLGSNMFTVTHIQDYLSDIRKVSDELHNITSLHYHLPLIKELEPRVTQFSSILQTVEDKLETFELQRDEILGSMNSNVKLLEDMYIQYESSLQCLLAQYKDELCQVHSEHKQEYMQMFESMQSIYTQVKNAMLTINRAVKEQNANEKLLAHLKATDAVTLAQFDKEELSIKEAMKCIKASEKLGNDEKINRARLNKKEATQSVANLLKGK